MLKLGLTGGIGSGKSTVSGLLSGLGAVIADADRLAREVVEPGTPGLEQVVAAFGSGVLTSEGALDRPALGRLVFGDPGRRKQLESIVHPLVAARAEDIFAAASPGQVVVHDVPLLVEKQMMSRYHLVLIVDVDAETRLRRLMQTRGMTRDDAQARVAAQVGDEQRREAADVLLDNSGTPAALEARIRELWAERLGPYAANIAAQQAAVGDLAPSARDLERLAFFGDPAAAGYFPTGGGALGSADPARPVRLLAS